MCPGWVIARPGVFVAGPEEHADRARRTKEIPAAPEQNETTKGVVQVIVQGTTPFLMLRIRGYDLSRAAVVLVTIFSGGKLYDFQGDRVTVTADGSDTLLMVHLTQEDTLALMPKTGRLQVRWRDGQNEAYATEIVPVDIGNVLRKEVI